MHLHSVDLLVLIMQLYSTYCEVSVYDTESKQLTGYQAIKGDQ